MKSAKNPILVIDRDGLIGEPLCLKLSKEFLLVFVSRKNLDREGKNIIHVPFLKKAPVIPDKKYSHIIFIDEEGQDLEFLPKLIDKAKDVNSDFVFAQGLSYEGKDVVGKILRLYSSAKVVLFGDIFSNELILRKESFRSVINKFIYQSQKFGKMQVLGDGLRETYPVFLNDVVDGLIDIVFGIHKTHSLFYIFPKYSVTELSLAHMIQKINPEVMVDFVRHDPRLKTISYPPNGLNLLGYKYPIAQRIRSLDIKKKIKAQHEVSYGKVKKLKPFPFLIAWILIFLLLFPLIFTLSSSFLGKNTFYYAKKEVDKGNFVNAKSSLHLSQAFFYIGKQALSILFFQAKIAGAEDNLKRLFQDLEPSYKISEGLLQAFNSGAYFSKILNGKSKNPKDDFAKGEGYLKNSLVALDKIKAEGKISSQMLRSLEIINPLIKLLSNTLDIMPGIFGMEKQKTYLILFQDNLELRPGGGVIDSYGILKFNRGKITQFTIRDIVDADQQLRGHVEPPFAVRRYLGKQHWYMKDSNFDVDFVRSASSSSNFLFVETGEKADGVIGVDASFIKSILQAIGPVYVEDYQENVDEDNLYVLMRSHAKKNPQTDLTQKKDFFRSLNRAIATKITGTKEPYLLVAQAIANALTQKHLLLVFKDWQNVFTVNGWSSSLWDERIDNKDFVNDFVGINEANLGFNKVNDFIKRQVSQKATLGDNGNVSEELTINYKNESIAWPDGDYKNYLRIILPKETVLFEISINDIPQVLIDAITDPQHYEVKNFKAPIGLEVEKVQEESKTIFGFIVKIPVGAIIKVKLKYTLAESVTGLDTFSYNLKLFKQPGVDNIPYSFSLIYPNDFNVIKSSGGVIREGEKISYFEKIREDKNLVINFAKK